MLVDLAQVSKSVIKQGQIDESGVLKEFWPGVLVRVRITIEMKALGTQIEVFTPSYYFYSSLGDHICQKMFLLFSRYSPLSILVSPVLSTGFFGRVGDQTREGQLTPGTPRPS